ncbi:hypothetical protein D9V86_00845 [Bacteroidetes/Chlorobi group bacterium ChocPot_Mid]|nr:MAG: hypothetical protein D9V86_00845 [Bacteroidetes/Chlorobi group bacterium ChocPot_Mid]
MKSKIFFLTVLASFLLLTSFKNYGGNETSLFDKNGDAKAYIADDLTIYLWDGDPVAYLSNSNSVWHVYGFNGSHLGWYIDGIIYDHNGNAVGAQKDAVNMMTSMEGMKGMKSMKPMKSMKEMAPMKPMLSRSWSRTPLTIFLRAGE